MGFQQTTNGSIETSFGHILVTGFPAGWPDQCLFTGELIVGESSSYVIEVGNCSYADDSSQLSQYWSLGQNWDDASMDLFFLGRSVNGTTLISGETSYQYVLNDFEDTQAIEVLPSAEYERSDYLLYIVY